MVVHHPDLAGGGLEGQQTSWVPKGSSAVSGVKSPDRIDALGWMVREFLYAHIYNEDGAGRRKQSLSSF
jgi:phage terminase large subunit-like protein